MCCWSYLSIYLSFHPSICLPQPASHSYKTPKPIPFSLSFHAVWLSTKSNMYNVMKKFGCHIEMAFIQRTLQAQAYYQHAQNGKICSQAQIDPCNSFMSSRTILILMKIMKTTSLNKIMLNLKTIISVLGSIVFMEVIQCLANTPCYTYKKQQMITTELQITELQNKIWRILQI